MMQPFKVKAIGNAMEAIKSWSEPLEVSQLMLHDTDVILHNVPYQLLIRYIIILYTSVISNKTFIK